MQEITGNDELNCLKRTNVLSCSVPSDRAGVMLVSQGQQQPLSKLGQVRDCLEFLKGSSPNDFVDDISRGDETLVFWDLVLFKDQFPSKPSGVNYMQAE